MNQTLHALGLVLLALGLGACGDRDGVTTDSNTGVRQTKFPGQFTAGGGTSGAVMASTARPATDGSYAGGTPGIAGGSGGTSSGAATAGTVQETGQGPSSGVSPTPVAPSPGAAAPGSTTAPAAGATPTDGKAGSGDIPSPAEQMRPPPTTTR